MAMKKTKAFGFLSWVIVFGAIAGLSAINLPRTNRLNVSVNINAETNVVVRFCYSDNYNGVPKTCIPKVVKPGDNEISFEIPEPRICQFRITFGFGSSSGMLVLKNLLFAGDRRTEVDWRDFQPNKSLGAFDVSADGREAVVRLAYTNGQSITYSKPIVAASRENVFVFCCRVLFLLFLVVAFMYAKKVGQITLTSQDVLCGLAIAIVVFVRFASTLPFPAMFSSSSWDDAWFVKAGDALLSGNWLGAYDHHTLIKGCFGPMVLAFSKWLGIPFLTFSTLLYIVSCLVFALIVSRAVKSRMFLFLAFCYLVFFPLSFNGGNWQKIYRNGMVVWQFPLLAGMLYKCYCLKDAGWRWVLVRLLAIGALLWIFFNTREDGVWIWPLVIVFLGLSAFRARNSDGFKLRIAAVMLFSIPMLVLFAGNVILGLVNKCEYGVFIRIHIKRAVPPLPL